MNFLEKLAQRINRSIILRNVVLALCALIVLIFLISILLNVFTRHGQVRQVPDLTGMTVPEAKHAGRGGNLRIEINDSLYVPAYPGGVILEQTPAPGTEVKSGRRIFVTVNSFRQKTVVIPYVTGYSLRQAKNNLDLAGLEIDKLIYRPDMATNYVLEERYGDKIITEGSKLETEVGSGITLIVGRSDDSRPQAIPRLAGFPLGEAKSRLWERGLNVGKVKTDDGINPLNQKDARVYNQLPSYGHMAGLGDKVGFSLTLDEKKTDDGSNAADRDARRIINQRKQEAE